MNKSYNKDLVSVVIPTYNQKDFVEECVRSVMVQTYKNIEIIIADDCSCDGTLEILEKLRIEDIRIKLHPANQNLGIAKNFNRAFDLCNGEYVAFLGGDDIMLPEKIEKQVKELQDTPNAVLCMHYTEVFNSEDGEIQHIHGQNLPLPTSALDWVFKSNWIGKQKYTSVIPSSCLALSSYYLHARYDERFKLKHELLFTLDDFMHNPSGKWIYIKEVLGKYRIHDENFSRKEEVTALIEEEALILCGIAENRYPEILPRIRDYRAYIFYLKLTHGNYSKSERKKIAQHFYKSAGLLLCGLYLLKKIKRKLISL